MIPAKGQIFSYFDDGKIRENRREEVTITEVIPFNQVDEKLLKVWQERVDDHPTDLFSETTDFFVKGVLENKQELIFVRSRKGWFSFNNYLWDGLLDYDGSLTKSLCGQ